MILSCCHHVRQPVRCMFQKLQQPSSSIPATSGPVRLGKSEAQRPALRCEQCSGYSGGATQKPNSGTSTGDIHWHDLACHIPKLWTKSRAIANKEYGVAGLVLQSQRVPEIRGVRTQHDAHWRRPEDRPLRFDPAAIAQRWFKLISWI
jgi:hypothetical protein